MPVIARSALVCYSAQQMFDLINDIEAYPQYMEGCVGAQIIAREVDLLEARLDLNKAGVQQSFTTRNQLRPPHEMRMELVEGPFSQFAGAWQFTALNETACKVSLDLRFEFSNKLLAVVANKWFEAVASKQVDALCQRAKLVYG